MSHCKAPNPNPYTVCLFSDVVHANAWSAQGSAGSCLATLEGRSEQPNPLDLTAVIDLILCESQSGENRSTQNTPVRQNAIADTATHEWHMEGPATLHGSTAAAKPDRPGSYDRPLAVSIEECCSYSHDTTHQSGQCGPVIYDGTHNSTTTLHRVCSALERGKSEPRAKDEPRELQQAPS